ncbi:helix-turn-helix transcriptional regulator [Propionibacterium freudenreichii]|uniref:helix-turn-helix transcriptional regulator n=1 Tax=Propionibacterium freudenreichii TaxID=1744 RepID=UPI00254CDB18|nr:helix-turn-helix domain-containing protein [Propionibacterium freudenreichii]
MNENDKYLSQPQAARYVGMSVTTIQRRIADGTLPAYRAGNRAVRVKQSDLDRMMKRIPTMVA